MEGIRLESGTEPTDKFFVMDPRAFVSLAVGITGFALICNYPALYLAIALSIPVVTWGQGAARTPDAQGCSTHGFSAPA